MDEQDFRRAFLELLQTLCEEGNASFAEEVPGESDALVIDMTVSDADVRLEHPSSMLRTSRWNSISAPCHRRLKP